MTRTPAPVTVPPPLAIEIRTCPGVPVLATRLQPGVRLPTLAPWALRTAASIRDGEIGGCQTRDVGDVDRDLDDRVLPAFHIREADRGRVTFIGEPQEARAALRVRVGDDDVDRLGEVRRRGARELRAALHRHVGGYRAAEGDAWRRP